MTLIKINTFISYTMGIVERDILHLKEAIVGDTIVFGIEVLTHYKTSNHK